VGIVASDGNASGSTTRAESGADSTTGIALRYDGGPNEGSADVAPPAGRAPGRRRRMALTTNGPSAASCLGLRDTAVCLAQVTTASGAGCYVFYELGLPHKASRRVTIRRAWEPWCSEPRPAASAAGVRTGRAATLVRGSAGAPLPQRLSRSD
jgi:hypothetical protein